MAITCVILGFAELRSYCKRNLKILQSRNYNALTIPWFFFWFFFVTMTLTTVMASDKYIKLEDIVSKFRKPCIMDLKMGRRVWDDYAQQDKIDREMKKYPYQEVIGFRIIGMRVCMYVRMYGCMDVGRYWCGPGQTLEWMFEDLGGSR